MSHNQAEQRWPLCTNRVDSCSAHSSKPPYRFGMPLVPRIPMARGGHPSAVTACTGAPAAARLRRPPAFRRRRDSRCSDPGCEPSSGRSATNGELLPPRLESMRANPGRNTTRRLENTRAYLRAASARHCNPRRPLRAMTGPSSRSSWAARGPWHWRTPCRAPRRRAIRRSERRRRFTPAAIVVRTVVRRRQTVNEQLIRRVVHRPDQIQLVLAALDPAMQTTASRSRSQSGYVESTRSTRTPLGTIRWATAVGYFAAKRACSLSEFGRSMRAWRAT